MFIYNHQPLDLATKLKSRSLLACISSILSGVFINLALFVCNFCCIGFYQTGSGNSLMECICIQFGSKSMDTHPPILIYINTSLTFWTASSANSRNQFSNSFSNLVSIFSDCTYPSGERGIRIYLCTLPLVPRRNEHDILTSDDY